jgi:hypothetical protein
LTNAGYDFVESGLGIARLVDRANDAANYALTHPLETAERAYAGAESAVVAAAGYVSTHSVEAMANDAAGAVSGAARSAYKSAETYVRTHSLDQMGEDGLRLLAGGLAQAGAGELIGAAGKLAMGADGLAAAGAAEGGLESLAAKAGSASRRDILLARVSEAQSLSEAKGIVHATREMERLGYTLEDVSLHYKGNQGLDLVFSKGEQWAVNEAKHGGSLSKLETYSGLRQGSNEYNISRLERYLQYGDGTHNAVANDLLNAAQAGKLESFASFYRKGATYELPMNWPRVPAIRR